MESIVFRKTKLIYIAQHEAERHSNAKSCDVSQQHAGEPLPHASPREILSSWVPPGFHSLALSAPLSLSLSVYPHPLISGGSSSTPSLLAPDLFRIRVLPTAKIALATLLEDKSRAEARASEFERRVAEMEVVLHAARLETDRLQSDLENQRSLVVSGGSEDRAQNDATSTTPAAPDSAAARRRGSIPPLPASMEDGRKCDSNSPPQPSEQIGDAGELSPDSFSPISAAISHGREEAERGAPRAPGASDTVTASPLRLAEAETRAASAERALLKAQDASKTATKQSARLGTELERARAAAEAEAEGRCRAQTRIAELERDIRLMGREQEGIRVRAESRLEALRKTFEQEEIEAGSKVTRRLACVPLDTFSARSCGVMAVFAGAGELIPPVPTSHNVPNMSTRR